MTTPHLRAPHLVKLAAGLGCVGIELRNDLPEPVFAGSSAAEVGELTRNAGLRVLALAEVAAFNDAPADRVAEAAVLAQMARDCGAEGIVLIPRVATGPMPRDEQRTLLRDALVLLQPVLEDAGVTGWIEPLGFENSTLRYKDDVRAVLDDMARPVCFGLIHDTFHHHLARDDTFAPDLTRVIHISGVEVSGADMRDAQRVLVGPRDRLGTVAQLTALRQAGCDAPASFEAFKA